MSLRRRAYQLEGKASYDRGSKVIGDQIYGPDVSVKKKPEKRSKDWGSKIYKKALKRALGLIRYFNMRNQSITEKDLVDMILREFKCGRATAKKVAKDAMK